MEMFLTYISPIIWYLIISWIINCAFTRNNNYIEDSKNKYAVFTDKKSKKPYQGNETFRVKLLKIEDAKSNHLSRVYLIVGFKNIPKKYTKLLVNQLDKDKNVINFKKKYINEVRYNEYENKTLFSEYAPNTIPKFYTTTMDFFIDDCNITEYFQYQIIDD